MRLSKEIKANAKTLYTLSVRLDHNEDYSESYEFLSLNTLIDTIKDNLADDYSEYDAVNMDALNPTYINENLVLGYGVTLVLRKVRNATSTIFEVLKPKEIDLVIGSQVVY